MSRSVRHLPLSVALLFFSLGSWGCDDDSASNLPEWTPADHTNQENPSAGQIDTSQPREAMDKLAEKGITDVVVAAWKANCVRCHGPMGQANGPEARMSRPPDMSDPQWQRTRVESEMKYAIKNGRGRMPAFPKLPDKTVDGLVQLVRLFGGRLEADEEATSAETPKGGPKTAASGEAPDDSKSAPPDEK